MTVDEAIVCLSDMKIKVAIPKAAVQARLNNDALNMAIEALKCSEIPNNWIPCSERLPDDLAEVNVTWVNHNPEPYYDFVKNKPCTGSAVYYKGDWYWYSSVCVDVLAEYGENKFDKIADVIEITAWMPLPEPYQEGGKQDGR